jgi:uncharacterized protein
MLFAKLLVKAIPNSRENRISGLREGRWEIRIKAPARDNNANLELISFLSEIIRVPKKDITIFRGGKARYKIIVLKGIDNEKAEQILNKEK